MTGLIPGAAKIRCKTQLVAMTELIPGAAKIRCKTQLVAMTKLIPGAAKIKRLMTLAICISPRKQKLAASLVQYYILLVFYKIKCIISG